MRGVIKGAIYSLIYVVVWNPSGLRSFCRGTADVIKKNCEKKNIEEILNVFIPVILRSFLDIEHATSGLRPIFIRNMACISL